MDYMYKYFCFMISDNFALVIGLGVGIPMFFIAILVVAVFVIYATRTRKKRRHYTAEDLDRYVLYLPKVFGIP